MKKTVTELYGIFVHENVIKIGKMKEVINKWELILEKHDGKDITYGRKVLIELLTDVKMALPNTLTDFLLHLNDKGLINNHDFDYEKEVKKYLKK